MSHGADSVKSILFALCANLAIAVSKLIAAAVTGSGSMIAESIHSLADSGNQLLLLLGIKRAKRPPTPDYPLGYGKAVYFWSFIVALMLFSMGGVFSIYEGFHKLHHPESLNFPYIAIGVLLFSIIAESVSMWGCLREVNKERRGRTLKQWFQETRQSDLLVVFGEDLAALLGLFVALIAIILTVITGNSAYDAMGSIFIGILLVVIALVIGIEVKALLIGQSIEPEQRVLMLEFLQNRDEIDQVFSLLTLQLGKDVMVAVKAKMAKMDSAESLVNAINCCEVALKEAFPYVLWLFFEPDLKD
ncbi:MAG: cation diffusion facilitator family transporter [Deltaproteobacteria bacterium]|jgi:cation diffusion facilitator family transporter|nr:cation diffusion facilitator family transporter [Deltaproteobacteria bacterium]